MARFNTQTIDDIKNVKWSTLLLEAVREPGKLLEAYSAFHNYSFGNVLLAMVQCATRGIKMGPLSTFKAWKDKGRQVQRGQKAITLCRPQTWKYKDENGDDKIGVRFVYENKWFVLSQTEGEPYELPEMKWGKTAALHKLDIKEVEFASPDGNMQGYSYEQNFAINPVAQLPAKTMFHELAHIVLGHTKGARNEHGEHLSHNAQEVEAESVALLCVASLGLDGVEYARGYIQHYLKGGKEIDDKTAHRIFGAADKILKSGVEE